MTEAEIPVKALSAKAKEYGVSMTVLLTAIFLCAIHEKMTKRQEEKPVVLMVPVNLRKYFPSDSLLNFFSWIEPGYKFGDKEDTLKEVVAKTAGIQEPLHFGRGKVLREGCDGNFFQHGNHPYAGRICTLHSAVRRIY